MVVSPGGLLLSVDVNDVLHQQVSLQAVHSMAVQDHLVAAGRAAEAATARSDAGGAARLRPQRVGCLQTEEEEEGSSQVLSQLKEVNLVTAGSSSHLR